MSWLDDSKVTTKSEKDAYQAKQEKDAILAELSSLDLPLHTLALSISGDSEALAKVIAVEIEKEALREKLKSYE